jgi:Protein of unknown function (DUF3105)
MAKKKKRRPTTPGRPSHSEGGVATATSKGRGPVVAPPVKPVPAEPGGPNRQVRKEEARRQREAIRRRMARRRFMQRAGIVTLVVVVLAGVGVYVALKPNIAKQAGCGSIQTIAPYNPAALDRAHITAQGTVKTPPKLSTYRTQPPTSGPHDPTPLNAGVYSSPPGIYHAIHSLEHGTVTVWFAPAAASNPELLNIESFYRQTSNNDHVIVAPYSYPDQGAAGTLPAGKQMVLVAWHHMQQCSNFSLAVVKSFVSGYRTPTGSIPSGYKGDAPEAGSAI